MTTTATLPTGEKVRTASKSPMVLFLVGEKRAFIEKRSANRATIAHAARAARMRWVGVGLRASPGVHRLDRRLRPRRGDLRW